MKIFIGYDSENPDAYEVCRESILRINSLHEIIPLIKDELDMYEREYQGESTEFAFTRFLVPYLCRYKGKALFCDSDFLWRADPQLIDDYVEGEDYPVWCVKHPPFLSTPNTKMLNKMNKPYPKKYWSSLMYFNADRCSRLTPERVNNWPASALHGFEWADEIGDLPAEFNAMINYYKFPHAKAVHFTDGGPWLDIHDDLGYSNEWLKIYRHIHTKRISF